MLNLKVYRTAVTESTTQSSHLPPSATEPMQLKCIVKQPIHLSVDLLPIHVRPRLQAVFALGSKTSTVFISCLLWAQSKF
jgi:hypothetical protein